MKTFTFSCILFFIIDIASFEPQDEFIEEWTLFKNTYNKKYPTEDEDRLRRGIFIENKNFIDFHNKQYELGKTTFKVAMNKFGDMPLGEFTANKNGFKPELALTRSKDPDEAMQYLQMNYEPITGLDFIDWRDRGAVTEVKDQGYFCGACWAFSATGGLEGQHYLLTGELISLSEQSLMDCSAGYENYGCEGGLMNNAFMYVKDNRGIATEFTYPYQALQNNSCHYNPSKRGATIVGHVELPPGNENVLKITVATVGPVCVGIDSNHESFQFYESGIYDEPACSTTKLDHGVLVIGYGTENGQDYWLIKNSWGEEWGMAGYMMMARNKNNLCGITTMASFPIASRFPFPNEN